MADAVSFRNACKSYGTGKHAKVVLDHLNMIVPKGSIYGLLGASGCGKTTLLSCIAGRLKLNEGELKVLGGVPGAKGSGVPGPRIGYMPQEVALVNEMNVKNIFYYFGWLFGMSSLQIAERYIFLSKLLELPDEKRLIKNMSGGQQRRVSFAAALVQTPELLILDEPTVGLDPVLRQSIWDYLVQLSEDKNMTIIITTHYIEEATQAHKIGLLREGTLLADMAPDVLIAKCNCTTLEEAFLLLSQKQVTDQANASSSRQILEGIQNMSNGTEDQTENIDGVHFDGKNVAFDEMKNVEFKSNIVRPKFSFKSKIKALLYKDILAIVRNKPGILFTFLFPVIQICTFYLAIGNEPYDLKMGIINDEIPNCHELIDDIRHQLVVNGNGDNETCSYYGLSCLFVENLSKGDTVIAIPFTDSHKALVANKKLLTRGTIHIPRNFSLYLKERIDMAHSASDDAIEKGAIKVKLDMSNYMIGFKMQKFLYDKFQELANELAESCSLVNHKLLKLPMKFNTPIYGSEHQTYREFMTPGVIITIVFYLSAMATTTTMTSERDSGIWNRNLVAGVTVSETITSYMLSQMMGIITQMSLVLLLAIFVFDMECKGNVFTMLALVFLQSFAGTIFGLFVGAFSKTTSEAMYVTIGSLLPYTLLIGSLWPLEGAPVLLRYFSYCIPGTVPSTSLLNILSKGWGWLHPQVYPGFLITLAWIVIPFFLSVLRLNKS